MKNWICDTQQDPYYDIIHMHGNGDCFFEAVIAAFKSCETYKHRDMSVEKLRTFVSNHMTEDIFKVYDSLFQAGLEEKNPDLILPLAFMRNVKNLDDLKRIVKTSEFWANETAISIIERGLQVKFIIFSEKMYLAKKHPCLRTAETMDESLNPRYYILLHYTGGHYDLVSYAGKALLSRADLPDMLKIDIFSSLPVFRQKITGWQSWGDE